LTREASTRSLPSSLLVILFLLLLVANSAIAKAQEGTPSFPSIQVNRIVQIDNGGALIINDKVRLSCDAGQNVLALGDFLLGFPIENKDELTYYFAYDASGKLQKSIDTSLNRPEFSWIKVFFPQSINVSDGGSYEFTVVHVFSGLVKVDGTSAFRADFPLYPSLTEQANFCDVTVNFPSGAIYTSASPVFSNMTIDSSQILYNETAALPAFANMASWARFTSSDFIALEVEELKRDFKIGAWQDFSVTDFYQISNENAAKIPFILPSNATEISVQDVYGTYDQSSLSIKSGEGYTQVDVSLREELKTAKKVKILIAYKLPFSAYVSQNGWQDFALKFGLTKPKTWVIRNFIVTVSLPEGGEFQPDTRTLPNFERLEREGFTETAIFAYKDVTKFQEFTLSIEYRYLILWAVLRPALWTGTGVAIVGAAAFLLRKAPKQPKPAAVVTAALPLEILRKFIERYEERRKITLDLKTLEQQVKRGKISRRQYKLRKSSLDRRLSRLQKDSAELRKEVESAGGRYAERMRRLETSETEIETLDRDISRAETRYRRGEISAEAHRRLLGEYNRRKEKAEDNLTEVLLRLKEEIR